MGRWKLVGLIAGAAALGVLTIELPGRAAPSRGSKDLLVGHVDLGQVTEQIKQTPEWKVMVQKFDDQKGRFEEEIQGLTRVRYLGKAERTELDNLRAKTKPTDGEKARITELEKRSDQLDAQYTTLAGVEKPTDEQKKQLDELYRMRQNAIADLQTETNRRRGELGKMEEQVLDSMQKKILNHVAQVAEGKGLVMVVDRQAILFGGVDLTPDVLKKIK